MTSGESERMYARHVPHTFSYLSPKQSNTPEPRKIPGSFLCTPDWIRTSDLQSRSFIMIILAPYPSEVCKDEGHSRYAVAFRPFSVPAFADTCKPWVATSCTVAQTRSH